MHSQELNEADKKVDAEIREFVKKQKSKHRKAAGQTEQDYVDLDASGSLYDKGSVMSDDIILMDEYPVG